MTVAKGLNSRAVDAGGAGQRHSPPEWDLGLGREGAGRTLGRRVRDAVKYRCFRQKWNIGVVEQPVEVVAGLLGHQRQSQALADVCWMEEEAAGFRADPFPVRLPGRPDELVILFEALRWSEGRGTIGSAVWNGRGFSPAPYELNTGHHLSYPLTVELDGEWGILPEQAEGGELVFYPTAALTGSGQAGRVIAPLALLDATPLQMAAGTWVFATMAGADQNTALHLFHAERLDGAWTAHPANPVKRDASNARPAGTPFQHMGDWFRPAQNCANHYGESIIVNRIVRLDAEGFEEVAVAELRLPRGSRYDYSLHTLSHCDGVSVIDAERPESKWLPSLDRIAVLMRCSIEEEPTATKICQVPVSQRFRLLEKYGPRRVADEIHAGGG